jgi:hypothetical protein
MRLAPERKQLLHWLFRLGLSIGRHSALRSDRLMRLISVRVGKTLVLVMIATEGSGTKPGMG